MLSAWWVWVGMGILILLAEALTPGGFYLLFVGIAAIVVGVLVPVIHVTWIELTLFALLSIVGIVVFRKPLVERVKKDTPAADVPEFVGETAKTTCVIPAGAQGYVELRGTTWKAVNTDSVDLLSDALCTIVSREGLSLLVKPKL